jgi:hypothetical protein
MGSRTSPSAIKKARAQRDRRKTAKALAAESQLSTVQEEAETIAIDPPVNNSFDGDFQPEANNNWEDLEVIQSVASLPTPNKGRKKTNCAKVSDSKY